MFIEQGNSPNTPNYIHEAKVCPIKNQLHLPNTPNYVREQMFAQLRTGFTVGSSLSLNNIPTFPNND